MKIDLAGIMRKHKVDETAGICLNVSHVIVSNRAVNKSENRGAVSDFLRGAMIQAIREFARLGRNDLYPLELQFGVEDGWTLYKRAVEGGTLWDRETHYGNLRGAVWERMIKLAEERGLWEV